MQNPPRYEMSKHHIGPGGHDTATGREAQPARGRHAGWHPAISASDDCCPPAGTSSPVAQIPATIARIRSATPTTADQLPRWVLYIR